jgi:hypothetical protein
MISSYSITLGLQMAVMNAKMKPIDEEQYAQTHAQLVNLSSLRYRIFLHTGKFFIHTGNKLTSASPGHMELKEEVA